MIEAGVRWYDGRVAWVLAHRVLVLGVAYGALVLIVAVLIAPSRREFFPEVDAGAFEMYVRAPSGTKLEKTNDRIAEVEQFVRDQIDPADLKLIVSEIGVTPDWSSAYTPNAGKMDAVVRIQLTEEHSTGAYEYADKLRQAFADEPRFADLEFAFNAGGLIRGALNEGKPTPINVRITGKDAEASYKIADRIRRAVDTDRRRGRRPDRPAAELPVVQDRRRPREGRRPRPDAGGGDEERHRRLQLQHPVQQADLLGRRRSAATSTSSASSTRSRRSSRSTRCSTCRSPGSTSPGSGVGSRSTSRRRSTRSTRESDSPVSPTVPLRNLVKLRRTTIPTEITDLNLQKTIDLNIGVHGRDLGHVASDVYDAVDAVRRARAGAARAPATSAPPGTPTTPTPTGSRSWRGPRSS